MVPSEASRLAAELRAVGRRLEAMTRLDRDAIAGPADDAEANDLIAAAVALATSDDRVARIRRQAAMAPTDDRPRVLARDLLISVGLAERLLLDG